MAKKIKKLERKEESPELKARVEQVENALKERKIDEALAVLEPWMKEIDPKETAKKAFDQLREDYQEDLAAWQADENQENDDKLNELTHTAYVALDTLHVMTRIKEKVTHPAVSPNHRDWLEMYAYFEQMPIPDEKELKWFRKKALDPKAEAFGMVVRAMQSSLLECFWEPSIQAIIDAIDSPVEKVSRYCSIAAIALMIYYNERLHAYPELRKAFEQAVEKHGDDMWDAFTTACYETHERYFQLDEPTELDLSKIPEKFLKVLKRLGLDPMQMWKERDRDERGYRMMHKVLDRLGGSWAMNTILPMPENEEDMEDDGTPVSVESREGKLCYMFIEIGRVEFLLDEIHKAESWLKRQIEEEHTPNPLDYLHFGHVMMAKGDREKGMDYYRKALEMFGDKEYFFDRLNFEKRYMKEYQVADDAQFQEIENLLRKA